VLVAACTAVGVGIALIVHLAPRLEALRL
jgi:hypothetical protein